MRWNLITPASELKPPTMAGHSASVHNGHMIIFGGLQKRSTIGQFSSSNDVWSFNTDRYALFRNKMFALNEMFQQNASKFAQFYV